MKRYFPLLITSLNTYRSFNEPSQQNTRMLETPKSLAQLTVIFQEPTKQTMGAE